ncbi:serine/threonine-protein kinase [Acrocarpospora catenulata]|uniref:serine/threonine-protein kinase n=1 Tax=Acrocarpospora catenulata TaxID=2836182 RepID=UPI0027DFE42A|nr:serine/threonine-protein kinase [Acrocarpospora catenulata]
MHIDVNAAISAPLSAGDPARIGPYRLLGRLGSGGMGTVYLGEDDGRQVAVKVVKRQYAVDEEFAARFLAEVAHAQRVASFCTALVLDQGVHDGRPYMVTEYIAGTPLDRQIAASGPLDAGTLHGVAFGVAAALTAIHAAGLVHRDLKPANVILSMSGPRVIDFGIARAVDATHGHTETGEVVGSPGWWAPEQLQGRVVTPAVDVFTWGCLVAYAGSGRHPFGEGDPMVLAHRVLEAEPDLDGLPAPLDHQVRRALHKEPRHRPTAQELLLALVGGREDPSTAVLPWEPPPLEEVATAVPPPRRRRWWPLAALAGLLVLGAGLYLGLRAATPSGGQGGYGRLDDIGRRISVSDVHVIVREPSCRPAKAGGTICVISWLLLNMSGSPASLPAFPALVDDEGTAHRPTTRPEPDLIQPGERVELTAEYTLPEGREPARLNGAPVGGGDDVEVRL